MLRRLLSVVVKSSRPSSSRSYSSPASSSSSSTIYALASGQNQRCSVAVVRVSGKRALNVLDELTRRPNEEAAAAAELESRKMYLRSIWHPVSKERIDNGLVVAFRAPHSFTGEDVCELHVHGGASVVASVLDAIASSSGGDTRYAEPGEFSRRAFLNGRMDLVEAEGLADLINAETEMQRRQALEQMSGSLSRVYATWRAEIIKCLANVEAYIDFSEEENVEEDALSEARHIVQRLVAAIQAHLNDGRRGERLRSGVRVAIVGAPNAGKSSLLNTISKRPAAIVSPIAGTTRDVVESALNIAGYPIVLSDTAGLRRSAEDSVEMEGVRRAMAKLDSADIVLVVVDAKEHLASIKSYGMRGFLRYHLSEQLDLKNWVSTSSSSVDEWLESRANIVLCLNKKDLLTSEEIATLDTNDATIRVCTIACPHGGDDESRVDVSQLLDQLKSKLTHLCSNTTSEMPSLTQQRHRDNLSKCLACMRAYLAKDGEMSEGDEARERDYARAAEDLRVAARWLGFITGHVTSENILDVIFRDFCIGK